MTRTSIAKAAAAVVRKRGLDALSVRSVAERLGVTPMALYRHVGSADGLRTATLEYIVLGVNGPPVEGTASDRVRRFAVEAGALLERYPGVAMALLTEWTRLVQGARLLESLLVVTAEVSDDTDQQIELAYAVFGHVLVRVEIERATRATGRGQSIPIVAAHPERFPRLRTAQGRFEHVDLDRHLARALDALLTSG
jgi:AcrR family transcriptional regulator